MQIYQELSILTARPTLEQETETPHRLYGALSGQEACSAAHWLTLARHAIDETRKAGKLPIVTGGTGLYIKTLMEGLSPIPGVPEAVHAEATLLWETDGAQALLSRDPVLGARLTAGDTQRHIRALGVLLATGKSLAYWQALPRMPPYPNATFTIAIVDMSRADLYARCDARFLTMLDAGALDEVKTLRAMQLSSDLPIMRAVGLPELIGFLEGKWDRDEAISKAQQATRNYAKRQLTWFRNQLKSS